MSISAEQLSITRERAGYKCEYCGVTEIDSSGTLTVDHYQPVSFNGSDELVNLVYACFRCNVYKTDYWPIEPNSTPIWNPRGNEPLTEHIFPMEDGRLLALSDIGGMTIEVLRLNRRPLIDLWLRALRARVHTQRLIRLAEITDQLLRLKSEVAAVSNEETRLLDEQRQILEFLRRFDR
jgi:hypothetical protein